MDSGGFNHLVTIERRVQVGTKSLGDPNFVWDAFTDAYCEIKVVRGREHFDAATKQRFSEDIYLLRCHYSDVIGIDATMEIVDEDDQRLNIKSIRPDAENRQDCIIECTLQDSTLGAVALMGYIDDAIPAGSSSIVYEGFTVKAKGGTAPYAFALASGALPTGLALNASTGAVSGTPTVPGDFTARILVTDAANDTHTIPAVAITIAA